MAARETINATEEQKRALIRFKAQLEQMSGEELTQGEGVKRACSIATAHLQNCRGER